VITSREANSFRIARRDPAAIAVVSEADFAKLQATGATNAELATIGTLTTVRSANLVASTRALKPAGDVILSAHIDSAGTPGAQDNASGVAVLLELARHLSRLDLPFRLRFVFFGAEEIGLVGSRAYLEQHQEDLQRCQLLFNMDSVGGKEIYIDMRGGVRNVSRTRGVSQIPREYSGKATRAVSGRWALLHDPFPDASNVPAWLQTAILDVVKELGYPIHQAQGASSDHAAFADAGIVATDIVAGGIKSHVPEDLPDQIDPATLERVARIVAGVVTRIQPQR
jgi:Zn-dependent M28 family amino/carboxypeptidase